MLPAIPAKYLIALLGLTLSAFVFNTSEFMPIALLIDISNSFSMTPSETGIMITAYAWVVALLSLPLMLLASRMNLKRLLLLTIGVFAAGQFLAGLATSFPMLMGARILVACAHSIFWAIVSPIGTLLVTRAHKPFALGIIASGSSIAMILGLPLGRVIGLAAGWRMTFLLIAGIAVLLLAYLAITLPKLGSSASISARELPALVRQPPVFIAYIITVFFATGYYTAYSYIEPFLKDIAGFSADGITYTLIFLGCCGLLGSALFSRLYGRHRHGVLTGSLIALLAAFSTWYFDAQTAVLILAACVLMGVAATLFGVALQAELMRLVPAGATTIILAIFSGIFNLGIGSGSFLGGRVSSAGLLSCIGFAGAALMLLALLVLRTLYLPHLRTQKTSNHG